MDVQVQRSVRSLVELFLIDLPVLQHGVEHRIAPVRRGLRICLRIVIGRGLDHAGQQRRLLDVQVLRVDAPVIVGGGLDTVIAAAVVHEVQIAVEDVVLRLVLLHRDGKLHFFDLVQHALVGPHGGGRVPTVLGGLIDQQVIDVLLGDRRGALTRSGVHQVVQQRSSDAEGIDTAVVIEGVVLDGQLRIFHAVGDLVERYFRAVLRVERCQLLSVARQNGGRLGQRTRGEVVGESLEPVDRGTRRQTGCSRRRDEDAGSHEPRNDTEGNELDEVARGSSFTPPS